MDVRPNFYEIFLLPGETANLSLRKVYTNGDSEPLTTGATFTIDQSTICDPNNTSDPNFDQPNCSLYPNGKKFADVDANGLVTAIELGEAYVTVNFDSFSHKVRVLVVDGKAVPHFGKSGEILTSYDSDRSIYLRDLFQLNTRHLAASEPLAFQVKAAGINALEDSIYLDTQWSENFEDYKVAYDEFWNKIESVAAANDLSLFLIGDDAARWPEKLLNIINNVHFSGDAFRYALNKATNSQRVIAIEMVDEVSMIYGATPTPDQPWLPTINGEIVPVPTTAFSDLMSIINEVPNHPPVG